MLRFKKQNITFFFDCPENSKLWMKDNLRKMELSNSRSQYKKAKSFCESNGPTLRWLYLVSIAIEFIFSQLAVRIQSGCVASKWQGLNSQHYGFFAITDLNISKEQDTKCALIRKDPYLSFEGYLSQIRREKKLLALYEGRPT